MPRVRSTKKLDTALDELTATDRQAVASARWWIELRGGLSHKHSRDYWRFSTKAELRGQVEAGERFVQGIKDYLVKKHGEVSIDFLPGPGKWDEKLAARLIVDAEQGDADADQVLREAAAECLERGELPPKPLQIYAATSLRARPSRKKTRRQPNSSKPQSHKTDYRDWILALTVDDIVREFKLKHTRNEATESKGKHCACSIVALATDLHENTVQNAWHRYQDIADQRTAANYVAQAIGLVPSDRTRRYVVRFPRVGSPEAMPRPKPQRRSRSQRHETKKMIGA
jgi:hypothetical protein